MAANNPTNKTVKVKITTDNKEAIRDVRELERQVQKLGSMSFQGQKLQDGFLSKKQVQLYKNIMREIDGVQKEYLRKLDAFQREVDRRQQQYNDSQARGASATVTGFYGNKLQAAQAQLSMMQTTVNQVNQRVNQAQPHMNNINNMHQLSYSGRQIARGVGRAAGATGIVWGMHGLTNYIEAGAGGIQAQEDRAAKLGMRMGGYGGDFRATVKDAQNTGLQNGYTSMQTMQTLDTLMSTGGTSGNRQNMANDVASVQQFGRAYGVDPNILAQAGGTLQQMGAVQEGDQRRFADLLAGAIDKTKSRGREEEVIRASTRLISQVGDKMVTMNQDQAGTVVGYQTMLGQSIPELRGERGASLLGNMDNAIKNGDQGMDVLLGKGSSYTGTKGMWELQLQKEKGISDPENLKKILGNLNTHVADPYVRRNLMREQLGLSATQVDSLEKSGVLDKMASGQGVSGEEIQGIINAGKASVDSRTGEYQSSTDFTRKMNDARGDKLKTDVASPFERALTGAKDMFFGMPESMQIAGLAATGVGGTMAGMKATSLVKAGIRKFGPNVGKILGMGGGTPPIPPTGGAGGMGGAGGTLLNGTSGAKGALGKLGQVGADGLKMLGKRLPVIGGLATVAIDQASNPEHSWGRSLAKGAGSVIGGILGAGATVAAGLGTGGVGLLAGGALTIGGSMAGEKAGDWLYSAMAGDEDQKKIQPVTPQATSQATSPDVQQLNVATLNVQDKKFTDAMQNLKVDAKSLKMQHEVTVNVTGGIDGMNDQNQTAVRNDFQKYFQKLFEGQVPTYSLSVDSYRGD